MKRHLVGALAALVILPQLAAAQSGEGFWGPLIRITPFVGISPNFKQTGEAVVATSTDISVHDYEVRFASGFGMGVAGEFRFWNRFSVIGSAMWSSRGDGELLDFEDEVRYEIDGTNFWMAKAGVSMKLREVVPDMQLRRLNASLYIAPAIIHDRPKVEIFTPAAASVAYTHPAINIGAEAEMPISNNKMAFVLGLEDYMVFWDDAKARGRVEGTIQQRSPDATVAVETRRSQLWVLRAGLTWRFF
jgi:hypothetical protein